MRLRDRCPARTVCGRADTAGVANIAELSVIVTGSVALGVPLINGAVSSWQARRAARAQRIDELRSVLDDAAVALLAFMATALQIPDKTNLGDLAELIPMMETEVVEIWQQEARIAVRLGVTHEVFKAFRDAHERSVEYLTYARRELRRAGPNTTWGEITARQAAAYRRFFDLAAALAGPDRA